ncbi:lipase family protein [Agromyces protaetiae]|uniref:lipase family protein n=1 Tax=Agromyces protaetiae TaxID=2509455 RepID=UPI001FB78FAC|nr:lipase family protein [Agromyces protaetiae]
MFGVLALAWPDITLLVVAVVFGARLIMVGLVAVWQAVRGRRDRERAGEDSASAGAEGEATAGAPDASPRPLRRWTRTIAAVAALLLAGGAAALSASLQSGSPVVDDFYAAPRTVPGEPGRLIRSEAFTRDIPSNARAWRILYTTTSGDGSAAVASGLVVVPRDGDGPWPVVDWTHGTTGFAENCAPSLAEHPFESGAFFLVDQVVDHGWALVATDYIGLGTKGPHPYLIGPDTGHAALDAARAARELDGADLGDQNIVWGHSQGGAGALWTGALADVYAPDLDIEGVASLAPASNLPGLVGNLDEIPGGSVFASYVAASYTAIYPDVTMREYIRPGAVVTVREMAKRCLAEPGVFVSVLNALALSSDPVIFSKDPTTGPLGVRLEENTPPPTISAPLLLGQGAADPLVVPAAQDAYVEELCTAGQQVDYRLYAGRDHVGLVEPDSPLVPDLFEWTEARLAGDPVEPGCTRVER